MGLRMLQVIVLVSMLTLCPTCMLLMQLLFLSGITLLIGARKTVVFFARPQKWRGTTCFIGGIVLVLVGQQRKSRQAQCRPAN